MAACCGRAAGLGPFLRCAVEGGTTLLGTVVAEVLGPRLLGAVAASGSDSDDPLKDTKIMLTTNKQDV